MSKRHVHPSEARVARLSDPALLTPLWLGVVGPQGVLMMPLIVGNLAERLHLSAASAGLEASAALTGACIAGAVLTVILRTVSWRRLGVVLTVSLCAGYGVLMAHPLHAVSLMAMFAVGLGMGGLLALAMTAAADSSLQTRATGLLFGVQGAVGAVLAAFAPAMTKAAGDRGLFLLLAAVGATTFAVAPALASRAVAGPAREQLAQGRTRVAWRMLAAALAAWGAINFASGGFWPLIERIAAADGQSASSISDAISLSLFVGITGGLAATVISTRFGRIGPLALIGAATIASTLVLIAHPPPLTFAVALCIFVFVWNMGPAYQLSVVAEVDTTGRSMPLALLAMKICMAVAPAVFGLLVDRNGYARAGALAVSVAALSTVIFVVTDQWQRRVVRTS